MVSRVACLALTIALVSSLPANAQGVRSRMRLNPRNTIVSKTQAVDLTLTVTAATVRPIQVWVRTAGTLESTGRALRATVSAVDGAHLKADQRARAFPVASRSSMYQARVSKVTPDGRGVRVDLVMIAPPRQDTTRYVVEIVTDRGDFLSVPNEAIIEEGDRRVVYVQTGEGQYEPREIRTGLQGELFTEVVSGVRDGEQVVTFGSFFIDSDYKLKGTAPAQ